METVGWGWAARGPEWDTPPWRGGVAAGGKGAGGGVGGAAFEVWDNRVAVVADGALLADADPRCVEVFGDGYRIGVHNLADENLIANRQNGGLHGGWNYDCAAVVSASATSMRQMRLTNPGPL